MVKLKDIALKTGLNISTVSRALLDRPDISDKTRRRVKRIAAEMGYTPKRSKPNFIGIIVPEVTSQYYSGLVHILEENLSAKGYSMIHMLTGFSPKRTEEAVKKMHQLGVAGIIISEVPSERDKLQEIAIKIDVPVVMLSEVRSVSSLDLIYIDQYRIISLAVEHLMSLGHRKIGYIGEELSDVRYKAYVEILKQHGIPFDQSFVKIGTERFEKGGYLRAKELLEEPDLPSAVIASYDQIAIGAIKAFTEAGLKVPRDMSIIGVDNIITDDYMHIRLTSITNPVEQLGIVSVKLLLSNIDDPESHVVQHVALQSELVLRESTAPPRVKKNRK
ncbi:MAG: LacI family transcriptional regulator [Clostridiales bacterium]|nr:LacI family transcriptional regulator [Clostridiales bacterium]